MTKQKLYYLAFVIVIIMLAIYLYKKYSVKFNINQYEAELGTNRDGVQEHIIIKK
jgi:hypothetical protein